MKKVFKSRIFIIVILCIISCGGVYGANVYPYQASDVSYNASNGETMNVNDALDALYNNKNNSTQSFKISNLKLNSFGNVGDESYSHGANGKYSMSFDVTNNSKVVFGTVTLKSGKNTSSSITCSLDGTSVTCTSGTELDVSNNSTLTISLVAGAHGWANITSNTDYYGSCSITYLEFF